MAHVMKSRRVLSLFFLLLCLTALLSACGASSDTAVQDKPLVIGQSWLPKGEDPTNTSVPWALTSAGVSETVYMVDREGKLYSRFVDQVSRAGDLDWTLTLKDGVVFSDGSAVDAAAFAAAMNTIMEKNPISNGAAGKMSFEAPDAKTVKVHTERPVAALESVLAEWPDVIFKETADHRFLFTGPYTVEKLEGGDTLELKPNPHYPDADKRRPVTVRKFQDQNAMKIAFENGDLDMAFGLTPDIAEMLEKSGKTVKTIEAGYQYMGLFNLKDETLRDPLVRAAVNAAVDRGALLQALKSGRAATGLFAQYNSFAGKDTPAFDRERAKQLLDQAGWKADAGQVRQKDGKPLVIQLVTYPSRPDLVTIMQIVTSQLKDVGFDVKSGTVDNIDKELADGRFGLALYAYHTASAGTPTSTFNLMFRTGGAKNFTGYSEPAVDAMIDDLGKLPRGEAQDQKAVEIQHRLYTDLPVLYLVDPQWFIGVSSRLADYTPYNGDYYIINAQMGVTGEK